MQNVSRLSLAPGIGGLSLAALLLLTTTPTLASQVQVLLFGQPCQLQGPNESFSEQQLRAIHQISPEQTPITEVIATLKTSLDRLKNNQDLPLAFKNYRDLRTSRIEARIKFEEAVAKSHRSGDLAEFSQATKNLINARRHAGLIKKFQSALKAGPSQRAWDQVRSYFNDFAGPDGEEDFHRTLRRLKVQYHCSFEDEHSDEEHAPTPIPSASTASPTALKQ